MKCVFHVTVRTCVVRYLIISIGAIVVLGACGGSNGSPVPTAPPPLATVEEMDAMRKLAFGYWAAYNANDLDRVMSYLDERYGLEQEARLVTEIGRRTFMVFEIEVSELTPPRLTAPDQGEMFLNVRGLGIQPAAQRQTALPQRIRMGFLRIAGEWRINFADVAQ